MQQFKSEASLYGYLNLKKANTRINCVPMMTPYRKSEKILFQKETRSKDK